MLNGRTLCGCLKLCGYQRRSRKLLLYRASDDFFFIGKGFIKVNNDHWGRRFIHDIVENFKIYG